LAVKIVRQASHIALLGSPTSAASLTPGHERGPAAWREAGFVERLREIGFTVTDHGDCTKRVTQPDDEHPRARNVKQVLIGLEELRPKVEVAVKSGALPLLLGGDDSIVLGTIAGCRRYYRNVSLVSMDGDAGLNEPATTRSGCIDGMVLSHVIGRGAPELVRFWGEPPLVREPNVALFGVSRFDPPEQEFLSRSPLRRYPADQMASKGPSLCATEALERVHGLEHEFVLLVDLDVIGAEDFQATNLSAPGGMRWDEFTQALQIFLRQPTLAALVVSAYNPERDVDGAAAKRLLDVLTKALSQRLEGPSEIGAEARAHSGEAAPASVASDGSSADPNNSDTVASS
jgi:arginase